MTSFFQSYKRWSWLGISGLLLAVVLHFPHLPPTPAGSPVREISRGPLGRHCVALTFDAGGENGHLADLLSALDAAHVHCTFFLSGKWAEKNPDLARQIRQRGHEIGNHTWSHPDLTRLDGLQIRSEIQRAEALLTNLTGQNPRPLFRAPYGARDDRVLRVVHDLGYTSIYWTIDSLDSDPPEKSPMFLIHRITSHSDAALNRAILLMHVGEPATAAAVPAILADLQRRRFTFVTVSALLGSTGANVSPPLPGAAEDATTSRSDTTWATRH